MKSLTKHAFSAPDCRKEWKEFKSLLKTHSKLKEAAHVLPFFKHRDNLSLLISIYFPNIRNVDVLAHEFLIGGDFVADLVIGDSSTNNYLLIEFEDGNPESVFKKKKTKSTPDWARRDEGAFSQLIDWLWKLDDMRSSGTFSATFGARDAKFQGLIIIGKDMLLNKQETSRLRWRTDRVIVDSNFISCISFDRLREDLDHWLKAYHGV